MNCVYDIFHEFTSPLPQSSEQQIALLNATDFSTDFAQEAFSSQAVVTKDLDQRSFVDLGGQVYKIADELAQSLARIDSYTDLDAQLEAWKADFSKYNWVQKKLIAWLAATNALALAIVTVPNISYYYFGTLPKQECYARFDPPPEENTYKCNDLQWTQCEAACQSIVGRSSLSDYISHVPAYFLVGITVIVAIVISGVSTLFFERFKKQRRHIIAPRQGWIDALPEQREASRRLLSTLKELLAELKDSPSNKLSLKSGELSSKLNKVLDEFGCRSQEMREQARWRFIFALLAKSHPEWEKSVAGTAKDIQKARLDLNAASSSFDTLKKQSSELQLDGEIQQLGQKLADQQKSSERQQCNAYQLSIKYLKDLGFDWQKGEKALVEFLAGHDLELNSVISDLARNVLKTGLEQERQYFISSEAQEFYRFSHFV